MKLIAMIAAHLPLLPTTSSAGRRARSAHAAAASDTCTHPDTTIHARWPLVRSAHFFLAMTPPCCNCRSVSASPSVQDRGEGVEEELELQLADDERGSDAHRR